MRESGRPVRHRDGVHAAAEEPGGQESDTHAPESRKWGIGEGAKEAGRWMNNGSETEYQPDSALWLRAS